MTTASVAGGGQWRRYPIRVAHRCSAQNVIHPPPPPPHPSIRGQEESREKLRNLYHGVRLAALVQLVCRLDGVPVHAIERAWKPRRHYRSLGEGNNARPILETYGSHRQVCEHSVLVKRHRISMPSVFYMKKSANTTPHVQKPVKKGHHRVQANHNKRRVKKMVLTSKNRQNHSVVSFGDHPISDTFSKIHAYASPIAGYTLLGLLIYVLFLGLEKVLARWRRGQAQQDPQLHRGGKWVRDRSLGGKEIFISSHVLDWNPLGPDDTEQNAPKETEQQAPSLPSWWKSHPHIHISDAQKRKARNEAQQIVKRMDDMRLSGQDYTFDMITDLYYICTEACISVRTQSMNIATSIYRFAVKRTVLLTSEGIGLPSGVVPVAFLCHLAEILKLDLTNAVLIIYAETAAKLRDAILQVCADVRGSGQMMATNGFVVRSVIRMLGALPLRIDDAALIGSSITLSTTEQERIHIYSRLCEAGPEFVDLIGKLLGRLEIEANDESLK